MLRRVTTLVLVSVLTTPAILHAGFLEDVGQGLRAAAFTLDSSPNPLSGGRDIFIGRTFVGNEMDFGAWDLRLQGPISLQVSAGGRALSELELSFTTAQNSDSAVAPLNYVLNYDVGGQQTQVSGSLLIDGDLTFNGFGFYDLSLTYSSRQDVIREGRFANDEREFDADLGPLVLSGNIFADVLAVITDPFFQAVGQENPFESFSGRAKLADAIAVSISELQSNLAAGLTPDDLGAAALRISVPSIGPVVQSPPTPGAQVVPEPTVLILMLLGIPLLLARRRQMSTK